MIKKFFKSFYFKISLVFIALLLLLSTLQLAVSYYFSTQFQRTRLQQLNREVALEFSDKLSVATNADLHETLREFHRTHPSMDFYLLDENGKVIAHSQNNIPLKATVKTQSLKEFIDEPSGALKLTDDPILGRDKSVFSASKVRLQNQDYYLLVILESHKKEQISLLLLDAYIYQLGSTSLILVISFTILLGLLLISILTRRLRAMTNVVELFELGQLNKRITITSEDELGKLAATFNRMADQMSDFINSLQETDRLRRELIRNVSHDLRTPLTLMKGNLESLLLNRKLLEGDELERYLEIVHSNTESLERLVEDLFELSKLEAREKVPQLESFPIQELISDVFQKFRNKADRKGVKLILNIGRSLPYVSADVALMERVLTNLLENALTYTSSGGSIRIEAKESDNQISIKVIDSGEGIPKDELPHVFEAYFRGRRATTSGISGTGLGLAIVRRIIELHGGTIEAQSASGHGATFEITLKKSRPF